MDRDKNKAAYKLKDFGPVYCINLDGQEDRWQYMGPMFFNLKADLFESRISIVDNLTSRNWWTLSPRINNN